MLDRRGVQKKDFFPNVWKKNVYSKDKQKERGNGKKITRENLVKNHHQLWID